MGHWPGAGGKGAGAGRRRRKRRGDGIESMAARLLLVAAMLCVTLGCAGARPYPTKGAAFVGAADARISYIGRVDTTSAAPAVMFDWPCVSANFAGMRLSACPW